MRCLVVALLSVVGTLPAQAASFTLDGLTFSAEHGGIVLRGASGSGTRADPFVVFEDIVEDGLAVLTVRGLGRALHDRVEAGGRVGFTLDKVVRNLTERPWYSFEMEVREILNRSSPYEDGLSFGQAEGDRRRFGSDVFPSMDQMDEPIDAVVFFGAVVQPGETVRVRVVITDYSPNAEFFILQRRDPGLAALQVHSQQQLRSEGRDVALSP